ncbi:gamma-glutamylcyclotransferase family protein [Vreelandella glaciei]|uniref:gamma-glutamylcyclotransferase family protein n=1 Tax=Vreelandella glaciei TaxID=186761 RepID=UPI0030EE0B00|tara:strand:+ start:2008 stop:2418 length:411 start_codon:yes stop_codon:yes gene_type:complete
MHPDYLHAAIADTPRVAVYGTLKQGFNNAHWLSGARRLGSDTTRTLTLYDIGPYPGAKWQASKGVIIEIYEISIDQLAQLDRLEDYRIDAPAQGEYDRQQIATHFGRAWVYLYNPGVAGKRAICEGGWEMPYTAHD